MEQQILLCVRRACDGPTVNSSRLACSEMVRRHVPLFYMLGVRPSRRLIPLLPIQYTEHPGILSQWD